MKDIVFITADSVRYDFADEMEFLSSFKIRKGITAAHYTRPSLASIHSSTYSSVLTGRVEKPSLSHQLSDEGYTCLGLSPNPNTDDVFGFGDGFEKYENFLEPGQRGATFRQFLAQFNILRKIYYKFHPPHAKSENRPADRAVVRQAVEWFNKSEPPRFLWIHLMETHRPYGTGNDALSKELDQKAFFHPDRLSDSEKAKIEKKYRNALQRADENVKCLLDNIETDPAFVFTSDHGEGLGDQGYYYHQPQLRRVDKSLIRVPVVVEGLPIDSQRMSLLDLAPSILASIGGDIPRNWLGNNLLESETEYTITIAPWHNQATVLWQDFDHRLVSRNADVTFESTGDKTGLEEDTDVPEGLKEQMRDLGYVT